MQEQAFHIPLQNLNLSGMQNEKKFIPQQTKEYFIQANVIRVLLSHTYQSWRDALENSILITAPFSALMKNKIGLVSRQSFGMMKSLVTSGLCTYHFTPLMKNKVGYFDLF